MYLDAAKKQEIFGKYGKSNSDTGSAEAQIALFSYRIAHLTEHMKLNRKDYSTERALTMLVGKRRALLNYLKDRDINRYRAIIPIPFHHGISFFPPRGKFLSIVVERNLPRGGKILLMRKTTTMTYRVRVLSTDARRLRKDA